MNRIDWKREKRRIATKSHEKSRKRKEEKPSSPNP
jgi:hypothetical protein